MYKLKSIIFVLCVVCFNTLIAQIRLPKLISDGVIFQRNEKVKIWGWAAPNEKIDLFFNEQKYSTQANIQGNWNIILPKQKAGGPHEILIKASNEIRIKDILFGDVWLCSGQSNMELPMERVKEKYGEIIKNSENKNIRQFLVPDKYNFKQNETDFESGHWVSANPENVLDFSAVAYFFAKEVYEKHHIPIGLINSALGGSPVEAWMSEDGLLEFPEAYNEAQKFKNDKLIDSIVKSDKKRNDHWYRELNAKDKGILVDSLKWSQTDLDDSEWDTMEIPGYWKNEPIGHLNGSLWFRKNIIVPKEMVGKPVKFFMGRIVDQDSVYVNGSFVGTIGYQYPPRRYEIKPGILKEGKNTVAVRVINNSGSGGFVMDKPYLMQVGNNTIDLKGTWKYKVGAAMPPLDGPTFIRWKPVGLYKAMIAPLLNLKIKGALWYQGESNTKDPDSYFKTFPKLIENWRDKFKQAKMPFLYVQLANFMETYPEPRESQWATLRQAQLEALKLPCTGMAVTIDLGEWNDIHPLNKQDVGVRLALVARKMVYGEKHLHAESPIPYKSKFEENQAIISFKNTGSGLKIKQGNALQNFSISNDGEHFVWAKAKIDGNKVVVWHDAIKNPTVVRYAWGDNPDTANLFTEEGLPASPFEVKK
ncbi:sialate O-acetylesterase [Flavobacteriaceae bacterium SZ-1-7]|uniref:sialate O-acetylesterase n=1 Tax=Tamlana sedimenti TaxID=3134126 RepID=UPI0031212414